MKAESEPSVLGDQLAKSKSEIVQMFLEETENLRASCREMEESEINEPTKKEAVLASLQSLRLSIIKRSVGFLNPEGLFVEPLLQYVTELGAAIDTIEAAYIRTEEADIDEPTKKEAVLHPLNILWNDINEEVANIK
ncbi:MAG: hypothetical protein GQ542_02080 [Desulforhopalus sp.]|jgi:hypothetical protein|nr:hypothetical protein [Desulforhopalus sp.]